MTMATSIKGVLLVEGGVVLVKNPIDSYIFEVIPTRHVRIVTYGCTLAGTFTPRISDEH